MSAVDGGVLLNVFAVSEFVGEDRKKHRRWVRVGAAFRHRDGEGMNIVLDALPTNGRLVVLPRSEDGESKRDDAG